MCGLIPGGSAGTSFCSGTEISISRLAMAVSSQVLFVLSSIVTLSQRNHPAPELLLLGRGVDLVIAHEGAVAVVADPEHADGGGLGGPVAHRHRPDRSGHQKTPALINPEGAQVIGVGFDALEQCRFAGGLINGIGRHRVLAAYEHLFAFK